MTCAHLYTEFKLLSVNKEGYFEGYASTFGNVDLQKDIVEKGAFTDTILSWLKSGKELPAFWNHTITGVKTKVGHYISLEQDDKGLFVKGLLDLGKDAGRFVYDLMKMGLCRGLSIGYNVVQSAKQGAIRLLQKLSLTEISFTPVPANPKAAITRFKSLCSGECSLDDYFDGISIIDDSLDNSNFTDSNNNETKFVNTTDDNMSESENKTVDEIKGVIPFKSTPKADIGASWDGPKETAAATVDDLKIMCAWVDPQNSDIKQGYKLPHHEAGGDHAVVWNGVRAAYGSTQGAQTKLQVPAGDIPGIVSHLQKHAKEFDKELGASNSDSGSNSKSETEIEAEKMTEEQKAGRVLAQQHLDTLTKCHKSIKSAVDELGDLVKALQFKPTEEPPADQQQQQPPEGKTSEMTVKVKFEVEQPKEVKTELDTKAVSDLIQKMRAAISDSDSERSD
ncbi:MAG: HK97 family phage prohead protease [Candidatus Methanoperedens sp.]